MNETEKLLKRCKRLTITALILAAIRILYIVLIRSTYFTEWSAKNHDTALKLYSFLNCIFNVILQLIVYIILAYLVISAIDYLRKRFCNNALTASEVWGHLCVNKKHMIIAWVIFIALLLAYFALEFSVRRAGIPFKIHRLLYFSKDTVFIIIPFAGLRAALLTIKDSILRKQFETVSAVPKAICKKVFKFMLALTAVRIILNTILNLLSRKYSSVFRSNISYEDKKIITEGILIKSTKILIITYGVTCIVIFCGFLLLSRIFTEQRKISPLQSIKENITAKCVCWGAAGVYILTHIIALANWSHDLSLLSSYMWVLLPLVFLWWVCAEIWKKQTQNDQEDDL